MVHFIPEKWSSLGHSLWGEAALATSRGVEQRRLYPEAVQISCFQCKRPYTFHSKLVFFLCTYINIAPLCLHIQVLPPEQIVDMLAFHLCNCGSVNRTYYEPVELAHLLPMLLKPYTRHAPAVRFHTLMTGV